MANLLETAWKYVLQKSPHELFAGYFTRLGPLRAAGRVAKFHGLFATSLDAVVADRHAMHVRRQVLQHAASVTDWLEVDDPLSLPGFGRNFLVQPRITQSLCEALLEVVDRCPVGERDIDDVWSSARIS